MKIQLTEEIEAELDDATGAIIYGKVFYQGRNIADWEYGMRATAYRLAVELINARDELKQNKEQSREDAHAR